MIKLVKIAFGSIVFGLFLLLSTCFLQNGPTKGMAVANSLLTRQVNQLPYKIASLGHSTGPFLRDKATIAGLQLEGMKNSLPRTFALSDWLSASASGWMKNPVQKATRFTGNEPNNIAGKIPVVNGAVRSADDHFNSLRQSLNSAASSF
jgi:hypothetical protein